MASQSPWPLNATLDCQLCGEKLRDLTPREAQIVSYRPYDFVIYCNPCRVDVVEKIMKEWGAQ